MGPIRSRNRRIPGRRAVLAVALVAAAFLAPSPAEADDSTSKDATGAEASSGAISNGPVLALGWSPDEDASGTSQNLAIPLIGWRWRRDGADVIDDFLARASIDFSWAIEPLIGGNFGDAEAFEASVVPFVHLRPLGWERVVPWLEGGIGIAYTGLRNYGLGSRVEFSDNVGVGVSFPCGESHRLSVGYRFRHLSHAGIFGSPNDGLNAHFLTFSLE